MLPVLFLVEEHFRGEWTLGRWKTRMAARGEKFEIDRFIPALPEDGENGLPSLIWSGGQLLAAQDLLKLMPPTMHFAAPGKAIFVVGQSNWQSSSFSGKNSESNVNWGILGEELAKVRQPLEEVKAALKKPAFDARLDYRAGFSMLLPHLSRLKSTANCVSAATMNELHQGELERALQDLEALLALGRCQENEPLIISQLVRMAIASIGMGVSWQALQVPGWTDSQLARMQAGWQSMEFLPAMGRSLEMERAMTSLYYENARSSAKEADAILAAYYGSGGAPPAAISSLDQLMDYVSNNFPDLMRRSVYVPLWRFAWCYQDELNYLQIQQALLEQNRQAGALKSGLAAAAFSKQLEAQQGKLDIYSRLRFALSAQTGATLGHVTGRAVRAETTRQLVLAAIGLKRYELRHGKPVPNLAALVPEFLPDLPADYMDGQPLRYRLHADGSFALYSVGENGRDDGGDPTPASPGGATANLLNGLDMVWPLPASPEEIAAEGLKRGKRK